MTGHVFVTRGDITRIAVDAWLLPSDAACHVTAGWHASVPALAPLRRSAGDEHLQVPTPEGWRREERVLKLRPAAGGSAGIWLGNVGSWAGEEPAWFADAARQFVRAAAADGASGARHGRAKPLVALPLIGTGQGGGNQIKGDVLTAVIEALEETVARHDVDAVLVTASDAAHAAAQTIRLRRGVGRSWQEIAPLVEDAERLAGLARAGRLVLFIGAGIGKGAGLPDWNELLEGLREQAGVEKADWERTGSVLDRARLIQVRLGGPQALEQAIAERFGGDVVSLSHTLLAALPVREGRDHELRPALRAGREGLWAARRSPPLRGGRAHDGRWILQDARDDHAGRRRARHRAHARGLPQPTATSCARTSPRCSTTGPAAWPPSCAASSRISTIRSSPASGKPRRSGCCSRGSAVARPGRGGTRRRRRGRGQRDGMPSSGSMTSWGGACPGCGRRRPPAASAQSANRCSASRAAARSASPTSRPR